MSTPYTAAINELRQMLMDTEFNKASHHKRLIGAVDGTNTLFVTYDKKLVERTVRIFVDLDEVPFDIVDVIAGEIQLGEAPAINSKVNYSAYWQFWLDTELKNFLNKGAETCGIWNDGTVPDDAYLKIYPGLKHAALYFACETALSAQINYLVNRRHSEEFNVEQDGNNDEAFSYTIEAMQKSADSYFKKAFTLRDDFFKGQGARFRPSFGIKRGQSKGYGPKR